MSIWETPEEKQDEWIEKAFKMITEYEMDVPAVLLLESMKPLFWIGGQMSRVAAGPFMLAFWKDGFGLVHTFENKKNVEKLIKMLEAKNEKEREEKKRKKLKQASNEPEKKGWRKYFRFFNF